MQTLTLLLASALPPEGTVYVQGPPTPHSSAVVVVEDADDVPDGFSYLLEADMVADVLTTWSAWRGGRAPTPVEAAEAVVYYAEKDAFLPVS